MAFEKTSCKDRKVKYSEKGSEGRSLFFFLIIYNSLVQISLFPGTCLDIFVKKCIISIHTHHGGYGPSQRWDYIFMRLFQIQSSKLGEKEMYRKRRMPESRYSEICETFRGGERIWSNSLRRCNYSFTSINWR